jgi:hypothetical protein
MQEYESRIIKPTGVVTLVSHGSHLNDFAAILATRKLRRDGEIAEVWLNGHCVYSERPGSAADLVWPVQGKAADG